MNRKYRRSLIVGGCLLCLLTGCAGNQNSNYEQGALDLENKEYESAIENFELAVAEKEHTAEAPKDLPGASGRHPETGCQDRANGIPPEASDHHP